MKIAICGQADAHKAHQLGTLRRNDVGSTGLKTTTIIMTTKPTMTGHGDTVCCASSSIRSPNLAADHVGELVRAQLPVGVAEGAVLGDARKVRVGDVDARREVLRRDPLSASRRHRHRSICAPRFRSRRGVLSMAIINAIAPVSLFRPPPPSPRFRLRLCHGPAGVSAAAVALRGTIDCLCHKEKLISESLRHRCGTRSAPAADALTVRGEAALQGGGARTPGSGVQARARAADQLAHGGAELAAVQAAGPVRVQHLRARARVKAGSLRRGTATAAKWVRMTRRRDCGVTAA